MIEVISPRSVNEKLKEIKFDKKGWKDTKAEKKPKTARRVNIRRA